jgi:hypothetical protein
MGSITREMALAEDARIQGTPAELSAHGIGHPPEDAFMVPGMGHQPLIADNDNWPHWVDGVAFDVRDYGARGNALADPTQAAVCMPDFQEYPGAVDDEVRAIFDAVDLETAAETFGPLPTARGPFVQIYPAGKFYPFDPKPDDVTLEAIAHGLSRICRYSGAPEWHYSVAEHSVHMARYLACRGPVMDALVALLHDAPEALSGFNDVGRPVKDRAPVIGQTEAAIYRLAIAPRFGLPLVIPAIVHEIDTRITADETAAAMAPMDWHGMYDKPLGVNIRCWSPMKAKEEFIETYLALVRQIPGMWREAA